MRPSAAALFVAGLGALHRAWALRPAITEISEALALEGVEGSVEGSADEGAAAVEQLHRAGDRAGVRAEDRAKEADHRSDPAAPVPMVEAELAQRERAREQQARAELVDADGQAGLHWAVSLGLLALIPVGGFLASCCCLGIPWEDRTSLGLCCKILFAVVAGLGIYMLLFLVPFALQSSDEVLLTANVSVPQARLLQDGAIAGLLERRSGNVSGAAMALSLITPDGQFLLRHKEGDGSWLKYHMSFTMSMATFNWMKAHHWNAKRQCEPISFVCTTLTMASMPFTHRAALPGAVILRDAGVVKGVFAVAGGSDDENAEAAAGAAKSAGYSETVHGSSNDFDLNPDEDERPQARRHFFR